MQTTFPNVPAAWGQATSFDEGGNVSSTIQNVPEADQQQGMGEGRRGHSSHQEANAEGEHRKRNRRRNVRLYGPYSGPCNAAGGGDDDAHVFGHQEQQGDHHTSDEDRELVALEKMEQLDDCVAEIEAGSDKVFRSILTLVELYCSTFAVRTQTW